MKMGHFSFKVIHYRSQNADDQEVWSAGVLSPCRRTERRGLKGYVRNRTQVYAPDSSFPEPKRNPSCGHSGNRQITVRLILFLPDRGGAVGEWPGNGRPHLLQKVGNGVRFPEKSAMWYVRPRPRGTIRLPLSDKDARKTGVLFRAYSLSEVLSHIRVIFVP